MRSKGFTFIELVVVIIIIGIALALGFIKYTKWSKRVGIERDTRFIYTLISRERMVALSEDKSLRIAVNNRIVRIKDLNTNKEKIIYLDNPFSGTISIYPKGIMSRGSIVFEGDLNLHPDVSCVVSDGLRLRMGQTYVDSTGKRRCR